MAADVMLNQARLIYIGLKVSSGERGTNFATFLSKLEELPARFSLSSQSGGRSSPQQWQD
jgi:hypothetical protein